MKLNKKILLLAAGALVLTGAIATITTGRFLGFGGKAGPEQQKTITQFDDRTTDDKETGYGTPTGEDPFAEMDKISKVFLNGGEVEYAGNIQLFDNDEPETMMEQVKFSGIINGSNYQYMLDSVEFLKNNDVSAVLYHDEKQLVVAKEMPGGNMQIFQIDSLKKYMQAVGADAVVYRQGNDKIIRVKNTGDLNLYGYALYYSATDYKIRKVDYDVMSLDDLNGSDPDTPEDENAVANEPDNETDNPVLPDSLEPGFTVDSATNQIRLVTETYLYKMTFNFTRIANRPAAGGFQPGSKYFTVNDKEVRLNGMVKDYELVDLYHERKK
jgi:hypothetical protein